MFKHRSGNFFFQIEGVKDYNFITNLQKERIIWPLHFFEKISSSGFHDLYPCCQQERQIFIFRREAYDAFHEGLAAIGHLWRKLGYCLLLRFCYVRTNIMPFYDWFFFFHVLLFQEQLMLNGLNTQEMICYVVVREMDLECIYMETIWSFWSQWLRRHFGCRRWIAWIEECRAW